MRPTASLLKASCSRVTSSRLSLSTTCSHFITPLHNHNQIHNTNKNQNRNRNHNRNMSTSPPQDPPSPSPTSTSTAKQPLPLPEPTLDPSTTQLNVNGPGVKLDHLGPLVVNKDGSLSRIANWDSMAEIEQQNTLRILGKRNMLRVESLKAQEGMEGGGK